MSLEEAIGIINEFDRIMSTIDPLANAVLKGHFEIEEQLDFVLEKLATNPRFLELSGARFARKIKLLRAFGPLGGDDRWDLIESLNTLRNKVAHRFEGPVRENALRNLRIQVNRFLPGIDFVSKDYELVVVACMQSLALLLDVQHKIVTVNQSQNITGNASDIAPTTYPGPTD
jgi:hypothetical protein